MQEMEPNNRVNSQNLRYDANIGLIIGIFCIVIGLFIGFYSLISLTFDFVWPTLVLYGCGIFLTGMFIAQKTRNIKLGNLVVVLIGFICASSINLYVFSTFYPIISLDFQIVQYIQNFIVNYGINYLIGFNKGTVTIIYIVFAIAVTFLILLFNLVCGTFGGFWGKRLKQTISDHPKWN